MTKVLIRNLCIVFTLAVALKGCEEQSPVEKAGEKESFIFGEHGKQQNDVELFMDKFIDVDLSMFGENWFEKYILLIGKKKNAIGFDEIEIQNEFSRYQIAPKIIYYDKKSKRGPIIIIEKCEHDLFEFILKTKNCDSMMLDKVIDLSFPFSEEALRCPLRQAGFCEPALIFGLHCGQRPLISNGH